MNPEYYKCLRSGQRGPYTDHLWVPGVWQRVAAGPLVEYAHGFHVVARDQVLQWGSDELWRVEVDDRFQRLDAGGKTVVRRMRITDQITEWNDQNLRLFAADCAERVLPIFEAEHPADMRPREAIVAARGYARGEITAAARAAAEDAAWDAAWDAARDAAGDAARAAARAAAWAAARNAARAAAWNAAWAAAWNAAGEWQTARLWDTYLTPHKDTNQ